MPKEITHIHIAEKIKEAVPTSVRLLLNSNTQCYYFGSIAPDIFYYDIANLPRKTLESKVEWGEIIHGRYGNDPMLHLIYILDQIQDRFTTKTFKHNDQLLLSFVCGFLTHIATDTIFHPYIYSVTGNYYDPRQTEHKNSIARHRLFETCLDQYILEQRNINLADFKLNQWFELGKHEKSTILNYYADSLRIANGLQLNSKLVRKTVYRSYRKASLLIQIFQNQQVSKALIQLNQSLKGKLNGAAGAVYGNQPALIPFESLPDAPHPVTGKKLKGGNVSSMMQRSIERGIDFVNAAFLYSQNKLTLAQLRKQLRPYSLNNGLERVATDDMQYSNVQSWPITPI